MYKNVNQEAVLIVLFLHTYKRKGGMMMSLIINGEIMMENKVVAKVDRNVVTVIDQDLAPLFFKRCCGIEDWLKSRAIDAHRTNSRLLKKALRLSNCDDVTAVRSVHGVTLTDRYWLKESGESLSWEDVKFNDNVFADLALKGDPNSFNQEPSRTPELTNTGSYEKCWKNIDGCWWLYKDGNEGEKFSELFICEMGLYLNFPMATYEYEGGYVRSKDFTNNATVNFEPASSIVGNDEDYDKNFKICLAISEDVAKDYLKMIYLDTLCFNMDRHTGNYGFLRSLSTGEIISLAPNYDNNLAFIARGYPDVSRSSDAMIRLFSEFLNKNETASQMIANINVPKVSACDIEKIVDSIPIKVDTEYVRDFILNGQNKLSEIIHEASRYKPLEELISEMSNSTTSKTVTQELDNDER